MGGWRQRYPVRGALRVSTHLGLVLLGASACTESYNVMGVYDPAVDGHPCYEPGQVADTDAAVCLCRAQGTWMCLPVDSTPIDPGFFGTGLTDGGLTEDTADAKGTSDTSVDQYSVPTGANVDDELGALDVTIVDEGVLDAPTTDADWDAGIQKDSTVEAMVGEGGDAVAKDVEIGNADAGRGIGDAAAGGGDAGIADVGEAGRGEASASDAGDGDVDAGDSGADALDEGDSGVADSDANGAEALPDSSTDGSCVCLQVQSLQVQSITWLGPGGISVLLVCDAYDRIGWSPASSCATTLQCHDGLLSVLNGELQDNNFQRLLANGNLSQVYSDSDLKLPYLHLTVGNVDIQLVSPSYTSTPYPQAASILHEMADTLAGIDEELSNSGCADAGEAGLVDAANE